MQVLQHQQHLRRVEPHLFLFQSLLLHQQIEELTSSAIFHREKQFPLVLECVRQFDHEWVLDLYEDVPLCFNVLDLVLLLDMLLLHDFEGIKLIGVVFLDQ